MESHQINLLDRIIAYQGSIRKWQHLFKLAEFSVLISVLDRTVGYGRTETLLTNGELVQQTGLADSTVRAALKSLCQRGVLQRGHCNGRETQYTILLDWLEAPLPGDAPTPQVNDQVADDRRSDRQRPMVASPLYNTEGKKKEKYEWNSRRAMVEGKIRPLPVPVFEETWRQAWRKAFPNTFCPGWGAREYGIAKDIVKRMSEEYHPTTRVRAFVENLVTNWSTVRDAQFAWMKQNPPPALPDLGFIKRFLAKVETAVGFIQTDQGKVPRVSYDKEGMPVPDTQYLAQFKGGFGEWKDECPA